MIINVGELNFTRANDMNVPVDVWLVERPAGSSGLSDFPWCEGTEECANMRWCLYANNYMPRKSRLSDQSGSPYMAFADTREELAELIDEHVLPLYMTAVEVLEAMIDGTATNLYYWEKEQKRAADPDGDAE